MDASPLVDKLFRIVYLQVNRETKEPKLKKWMKKKGTHANVAAGRFNTKAEDLEAEARRFCKEMEQDAKKNI